MKRIILMITIIIINFIFQTSLFGLFGFTSVVPNLSLVLLVIFAMMSDGMTGGILGFITGALYDGMLYDVFGIHTLIYFLIGAVVGTFSVDMIRENYAVYAVVTGASTGVMHFLLYLILFFLKHRVELAVNNLSVILMEIIINTVLVIFVLKFIIFLFNKLNVKA
ncbi:MAG TPA: rod shape-determining protein MreD [Tissierellia bacterium]|jgi:rod shape-determining protein MreD|nr:rod shape-determining protein MreD [Tissierellia bacterium]